MKINDEIPFSPIQAMLDHAGEAWQRARADSQLTLGQLITLLKAEKPTRLVHGFGELDSYRGYYDDLAFAPSDDAITAQVLLDRCQSAMGKIFTGYKGGDFLMGEQTPLWIAPYGNCGSKLVGLDISEGQPIVPITCEEDD